MTLATQNGNLEKAMKTFCCAYQGFEGDWSGA